jgi:hypothetical protein
MKSIKFPATIQVDDEMAIFDMIEQALRGRRCKKCLSFGDFPKRLKYGAIQTN